LQNIRLEGEHFGSLFYFLHLFPYAQIFFANIFYSYSLYRQPELFFNLGRWGIGHDKGRLKTQKQPALWIWEVQAAFAFSGCLKSAKAT